MKKVITGYDHVTPELLAAVKVVLAEYNRDTYSVSHIYGAHNGIMQLNETPQSCRTCLLSRAQALQKWYVEYEAAQSGKAPATVVPPIPDAVLPLTEEQEAGLMSDIGITAENTPQEYKDAIDAYLANAIPNEDLRPLYDAKSVVLGLAIAEGAKAPGITLSLQKVNKETGVAEGDAISAVFTPNSEEDATKGTIINTATGKGLAAGKYITLEETPRNLSVQVGAKATFVVEDLT